MIGGISTLGRSRRIIQGMLAGAIALLASLFSEPRAQAKCSRLDHLFIGTGALLALPAGIATSFVATGVARATNTHDLELANGISYGMLGTAVGAGVGAGVALAARCPTVGPLLPVIFGVPFAAGAVVVAYNASPPVTGSARNRLVSTRPVHIPLLVIAFCRRAQTPGRNALFAMA